MQKTLFLSLSPSFLGRMGEGQKLPAGHGSSGAAGREALRNQNERIGRRRWWLKTDDGEKGLKKGDNRDG